jgi:L-iditol 2-dehydrogenase
VLLSRGAITLVALLSTVVPLREGAAWFSRFYDRERGLLKVVLTPCARLGPNTLVNPLLP